MRLFAFLFFVCSAACAQIPGDFKLSDLPERCGYSVKPPAGWVVSEFHGEVCSISFVPADLEKRGVRKFTMEAMRYTVHIGDCGEEDGEFRCMFDRDEMLDRKPFRKGYLGLNAAGEMGSGKLACGDDRPLPKHPPCWWGYFWFKDSGTIITIGDKVPLKVARAFVKSFAFARKR